METKVETNYEEELRERLSGVILNKVELNKVGGVEDEAKKIIFDVLSKHPDIWDISFSTCYIKNEENRPEGYIRDIVICTGRTKCEICDEYYLKTREWSKFCSAACRQAAFRAHNEAKYERGKMEADEVAAKHGWRKVHNTPKKEEVYKEWILSLLDNAEDLKERFLVEVGDKEPIKSEKQSAPEEVVLLPEN
jgi:hypothetical protein